MRLLVAVVALLAASACENAADIDPDDNFSAAPDVTGDYTSAVSNAEGCDGSEAADAFAGELTVEGTADALLFTFAGMDPLTGLVDDSFFFEVSGTPAVGAVYISGGVSEASDQWTLSGEVELTPADSDCEIVADFTAIEVFR